MRSVGEQLAVTYDIKLAPRGWGTLVSNSRSQKWLYHLNSEWDCIVTAQVGGTQFPRRARVGCLLYTSDAADDTPC
eukprot:454631-Amphidinium_carterae.2